MHPLEWLKFFKLTVSNLGKDVEQLEFSYILGGNIK